METSVVGSIVSILESNVGPWLEWSARMDITR